MAESKYNAGHRNRLRQKFMNGDVSEKHDYEVLELILTYAIPRKDVKPLAKDLLEEFGSIRNVLSASIHDLCKVSGIGPSSALLISIFKQVGALYIHEKLKESTAVGCNRADLYDFLRMKFDRVVGEHAMIVFLDASSKVINCKMLVGGFDAASVSCRNVVSWACENKASLVLLAHNHPHGKASFSDSDIWFTRRLIHALELFDINFLDHILVCGNKFISLQQN